ncbi:hypothetical protein BV20DRAFT_1057324 [Pilatotrama ljubarskyi]|nr:hypothetical protein BV20DRAFT_1057324 [Pilatotrama ljubarskyi]
MREGSDFGAPRPRARRGVASPHKESYKYLLRRITESLRVRVEPDETAKSVTSTREDSRTVANIREELANTCKEIRSLQSTAAS